MLLVVDIGNTNIVIGAVFNSKVLFTSRLSTDHNITKDQYTIQIKNILDIYNIDISLITDCIISSVVPPLLIPLKQAISLIIKKSPLVVGPGIKTGLNITVDNPAQVGADLIVNAVACINEYSSPLIIIDMGTATTLSIIDINNNYIGGVIIPGVKISMNALSSTASQLPFISLEQPKKSFGTNTIDCMKSGIIIGNASMIDGMIDRIEGDLSYKTTVVATGGIASTIIPYCKKDIIYDENLMLKGLYYIYNKNKKIT